MKLFIKYFTMIFLSISSVLIISLFIIINIVGNNYLTEKKNILINNINMLNNLYTKKDFNYENKHLKTISNSLGIRITVIEKNGKVIYDSTFSNTADLEKVENHLGRKEIDNALKYGIGDDSRVSSTVKVRHLYVAKLIDSDYILRVSLPYKTLETYLSDLKYHIILIFLLIIITIFLISHYFSKKLSIPIENINEMISKLERNEQIYIDEYNNHDDKISQLMYNLFKMMISRQNIINEERSKMHSILSALSDGVIMIDQKWHIIYMNDKIKEIFGDKIDNSLENLKDFEIIKLFSEIKSKGDGKHFTKYGGRFYEITSKSYENHRILVFHDSTDQMRYHTFKSEIVANISHELKTPVSILMGYAETLNNEDIDEETKKKFIKKIFESSVRIDNLINDIIELHSLESRDRNFTVPKPVSSEDILQELQEIYKDCSKNLIFQIDNTGLNVYKEHILSILKNLIDNAVTYSTGDNVVIELKKSEKNIVISVDDEGPAIPEEEKNKIFERFYTGSKSRNKKRSGTGLGLAIVKHTCELYNGYVELQKNTKGGNCFKVVLTER